MIEKCSNNIDENIKYIGPEVLCDRWPNGLFITKASIVFHCKDIFHSILAQMALTHNVLFKFYLKAIFAISVCTLPTMIVVGS